MPHPTSQRVQLEVDTTLVDREDDACLDWLQKRYAQHDLNTRTSRVIEQLKNDVSVCDAARWKRFAFPSDPYSPLRTNFNNEDTKKSAVKVVVSKEKSDTSNARALLAQIVNADDARKHATADVSQAPVTAPPPPVSSPRELSRNVWEMLRQTSGTAPSPLVRPALGGYIQSTGADALRFLVFPQRHHATLNDPPAESSEALRGRWSRTLQPVPYYVRGTARLDRDAVTALDGDDGDETYLARLLTAIQINLFAALRLPRRDERSGDSRGRGLFGARLWRDVDAVDVELCGHNTQVERRYAPEKNKVERCTLVRHGLAMTLSRPDPRHGLRWEVNASTVGGNGRRKKKSESDKHASHDDLIVSLTATDTYDSTSQKWNASSFWRNRRISSGDTAAADKKAKKEKSEEKDTIVSYGAQWRAGPGLELVPADACATLYGKLSSALWVTIPLVSRFSLKLRHEATFVQPFTPRHFQAEHVSEDGSAVGEVESGTMGWLRPHRYFWATQGPKWNPKLVRGFENDYSSMHHAQRWYAIFSAEISRKKQKQQQQKAVSTSNARDSDAMHGSTASAVATQGRGDGFLSRVGLTAFVNACFSDSLRAPPRASVGCSLQSDLPRFTADAFNKLTPSTFECSFSWFVAVKEKKLMSGLQPGAPDDQQFMRVSPVETFQHMKCGLTWNF